MNRRDILKYTALMTGAALSTPLILSLESCKSDTVSNVANQKRFFFDDDQIQLVKSLIDIILPKTDSPAASEVGVHYTIDQMVGQVYNQEDKESYKAKFSALSKYLDKTSKGKPYHDLPESERLQILKTLSQSEEDEYSDPKEGFIALKQQTIAYYLNTEEIGTKYLNYLPVPGQYEGCVTLESVGGKAWAI